MFVTDRHKIYELSCSSHSSVRRDGSVSNVRSSSAVSQWGSFRDQTALGEGEGYGVICMCGSQKWPESPGDSDGRRNTRQTPSTTSVIFTGPFPSLPSSVNHTRRVTGLCVVKYFLPPLLFCLNVHLKTVGGQGVLVCRPRNVPCLFWDSSPLASR